MNVENEYERLKKLGYTEEEIEVALGPISKLTLGEAPMGPERQDKSVYVTDPDGKWMRTSNIMLGRNRKGIPLTSGEYVSLDELKVAVSKYVSEHQEERKIVCKKTGKIVDVSSMSNEIASALADGAQIHLGGPNASITNQDTMSYTLGQNQQTGLFMLGNRGFKLSTGDYVTIDEFQKAIEDYVYMEKEKEDVFVPDYRIPTEKTHHSPENPYIFPLPGEEKQNPPEIIIPGKEETSKPHIIYLPGGKTHVVSGDTSIIPEESKVPAVIPTDTGVPAVIPTDTSVPAVIPESVVRVPAPIPSEKEEELTTAKKATKKKVKKKRWFNFIPLLVSAAIIAVMGIGGHFTKTEKQDVADYVVHQMEEQVTYKSVDEIVQDTLSGLKTGDTIYMGEGQAFFHESDRVSDIYDTFGNPEGLRPTGDYKVEYFSILHNGKIQNVTYQEGVSLSDMLEQTSKHLGVPQDELTVMGHAVTEDGKIAGWVNVEEAVRKGTEQHQKQVVDEISLVEGQLLSGTEHDFDGSVTMTDSQGHKVSISLTDNAGDLLDEGSRVVGSDNETYQVESVDINTEDVKSDDFSPIKMVAAGLVGAAGIGATYALNRKKEEKEETESELAQMLNGELQSNNNTQKKQR